jgi:hypothetical protein
MGKRSFRFYIRCQVLMAACMSMRCTSEMSVYYNETTWRDIPEGSDLHLGFSLTAITYTPQELEIWNFVTKIGYKHPYKLCTESTVTNTAMVRNFVAMSNKFNAEQALCKQKYYWCSELSSGLYCRVNRLSTDVSEVRTASIIRDE